ncbi:MAG: DNA polymerase, partial [Oscillospiraceae bacterium]
MLTLFEKIEMPLCEVLADMETEGFAVDVDGLKEFGKTLEIDITAITSQIYLLADEEFNINSPREIGRILFEKLGLPANKKTKTGYSTNADVLVSLEDKHEIVPYIIEYRKLTKLLSTYVTGLQKVVLDDHRVHSTFNQTETRTGRISSTEPNVQNIPIRTKRGSEMRKFFVAREGYTLVDADYSQIELRILAHISKDANMINAFLNGDDIHSITASQVFNCPLSEMTPQIRSRAKAINFGIVYGISAFSLSKDIDVSVDEAKSYIEAYMECYSGVSKYMQETISEVENLGYAKTLYGRRRDLSDINSSNKLVKAFASRVARNMPIQGTAADIIKLAMIRVHNRIKKEQLDARLILQVHDELIVEAPAMQVDAVKKILKEE